MKRFLVVGDLNVDVILTGMTEFPELGREIHCEDVRVVMGGSSSIFACRLAQLGADVDIFGKVGKDENGEIVLNTLRSNNVGTKRVMVEEKIRTGVTFSLTYPNDKAQITYLGSIGSLESSDVKPELFNGYGHLHVSSIYLQRKLLDSLASVFAEAEEHRLTTSLDSQGDPLNKYEKIWEILDHTEIFLPNESEAKAITRSTSLEDALEKLGSTVPTVVIKRGSLGAVGRTQGETATVDAIKIDPVDTTGAGDSFDAGFIYHFVGKSESLDASVRFANALGALSCLYVGGAGGRISEADVLRFISETA